MRRLQEQARALGDPTRHAIFRFVVDARRPVTIAELTGHLGLHHNAIRQHLAKLVEAGLVVSALEPTGGRGRPRLVYEPDPTADSRWGAAGPYERLSLLLAEVVRTGQPPVEVGRRAGQRIVAEGDRRAHADPVDEIVEQMARQGFDPVVKRHDATADVVLQACPFSSTAVADPDVVCALHLGLAQGIADGVGGLVVDGLVRKDPRRAGCCLTCHLATDG